MGGATAIISAQIRAQDLASSVVRNFANVSKQAIGQVNTVIQQQQSALASANKAYKESVTNMQQYQQEQHRMGMSTGRLIVMMVKFGIILKALQLATAPLRILG
jgi:DNA topoisomerase VI subunit B